MSYPQFGYTYPSSSQLLMTGQHTATTCCESGRPIMTDPHTGQTVCSCQYDTRLLSYPRLASGLPVSMYSSAYADQSYVPFGADPSAFYSPLDNADAWRGLPQPTACYPYDPTMTGYPYGDRYGGVDLNGSARRKNATRETTSTLKAWLYEHRKNPYPTKGEKIMLAIITKMTLTQVSTWFANARRRLKKENKMTWSPRNRCGDERDKLDSDIEDSDSQNNDNSNAHLENTHVDGSDNDTNADETQHSDKTQDSDIHKNEESQSSSADLSGSQHSPLTPHSMNAQTATSVDLSLASSAATVSSLCKSDSINSNGNNQVNPTKPRIWSLAHTATSPDSPALIRRPSSPNHGAKTFGPKPGQNLCSPMSTLRNWVDGVFHGPTSLSHPGVVQYPGLNVISSHSLANTSPATSSSNPTHIVQQTTSNTNPIRLTTTTTTATCYPGGQSAPLLTSQALLHPVLNGGLDRSQGKKRELLDQKVDLLVKDELDNNTNTAFKPVTKSKYNELMMA